MERKIVYFVCLLLLLADLGFSFLQHYNMPLDGDMPLCIVPQENYKPVLANPLGLKVVTETKSYANPNRFFSHWLFYKYFNSTPLFLQKFTTPINSVYLSGAIAKIFIQLWLIFLLAAAITGTVNFLKTNFILAAILITPFFQTNGYRGQMAIIDPSVTYTFFYALPAVFLLLYFIPFIRQYYHDKPPKAQKPIQILLILLAFVVCLSGPLNPGIVLVFSCLVLIWAVKKSYITSNQKLLLGRAPHIIQMISKSLWFYLIPVGFLAVYSLYLGRYNTFNDVHELSLWASYSILPKGIFFQFTQKLGFPVLFTILTLNATFIRKRYQTSEGKKIISLFKRVGLFALIYILLLPLGGYREYRALILRYDTIMPITLSLIFLFGISSLFLIKNISGKQKRWYFPLIVGVLLIFTYADEPEFDRNNCEKMALKEIAESSENIVKLNADCSVLGWDRFQKPADSDLSAQLLQIWKVTDKKKCYYTQAN